jgi:hypothetical protein
MKMLDDAVRNLPKLPWQNKKQSTNTLWEVPPPLSHSPITPHDSSERLDHNITIRGGEHLTIDGDNT